MMQTVGRASLFKCLRICNSTSIALSTLQLTTTLFIVVYSESDKKGLQLIAYSL